jgi:predicted RNA binding protein YcfA (HicA-like mRNA interferase family)
MRIPRDINAREAVAALCGLGFQVARQKGSHIRLTNGQRRVTVPAHNPIAVGTLRSIIKQAGVTEEQFMEAL